MKKYLLFIISMLCVSIGTWAEKVTFGTGNSTYEDNGDGSFTITINKAGDVAELQASEWDYGGKTPWKIAEATKIILKLGEGVSLSGLGEGGSNDLYQLVQGNTVNTIDVSNIENISGINSLSNNFINQFENLIVSSDLSDDLNDYIFGTVKNVFSVSSSKLIAYITNIDKINWTDVEGSCTELAVVAGSTPTDYSSSTFTAFDFTGLSPISSDITVRTGATVKVATVEDKGHIKGTDESNVKVFFDGDLAVAGNSLGTNISTALAVYDGATIGDIVNLTVTGTLTTADVDWLDTSKSSLTNLATLDLTGVTFDTGVTKASVATAVPSKTTVLYPSAYTVTDGCTVTIDTGKALGDDMSTMLAKALAAVKKGGQSNICTLIITGTVSNLDLAALADASMNNATRIDLSGATLASGTTIESIRIPSTLTSLVLPKGMTVSAGLATKLAAVTTLNYAYSPTTSTQNASQAVADYVWVNQAGGLDAAITSEAKLKTAVYVKIGSVVELNSDDVNLSDNSINASSGLDYGWQYVDMSDAKISVTEIENYKAPYQGKSYRIILPDNWTNDNMAAFAANTNKGSLAAVYSYEGSKLNILVITNTSYSGTALHDSRIVRSGTNAIAILRGTYVYDNPFEPYDGDFNNDGTKDGIINAINNADASIKSVYISIGNTANSVGDTYTFTNPNITYLSLENVMSAYGTNEGAHIVISGATALQTLNLKNGGFGNVTATGLTNLQTVDLTGATINGATNLSNTGLTTLTTNSSTTFKGNLNLANTKLTSFANAATFTTGDINLNGTSTLESIDLTSLTWPTGSKIHVHATDDESNTNVLNKLNADGQLTISVPSGFDKTRIHPNDDTNSNVLDDNIAQAATSGDGSKDGDQCYIEYDANTKTATAHINTAGHLADLLYSSYASYPEGTTFKFAAGSQINENDLEALAGYIKKTDNTEADYAWRSNYYYVDLYDLTATDALCNNTTGVIGKTISWLRTNNRQFKGLILPLDHTLYGSGISLIQSENANKAGELSTCSEFIAYYKTKEMKEGASEPTNLTKKILFTHVYNQTATNSEGIQASNDKLTELLTAHGLNGAGANAADLYSVSTNGTTPFDATALVGSKGYVETFNNEMVGEPTKANIYAYPKAAGEYTTFVGSSSIGVTPTEVLKIAGTVSDDASAVATAFNTFGNGPRVLDLSKIDPNDDTFLKGVLEKLTNVNIEYIILPEGKSKELVCNTTYSASLTKLKAVISSSNTDLVAYVNKAGSLAEARYLATGGSVTGNIFTPTITGLQSVTLAGNLNASDIAANTTDHYLDENGHWTTTSGNLKSVALWGEQGTITTIDLKDAVFEEYTPMGGKLTSDMNFSYAGLGSIRNITLPTSKEMTLIPENCFNGVTSFDDLCIPYNYTKIDNQALFGSYCSHITTTDAKGALVDNGPKTYTFSKNLEEIGTKPAAKDANGVYSLSETVFPQNRGVTDVYVLAHKVPKCYANAFPANMLYGWGGFKGGDFPYCREKYDNSSDGSMIFTVLHFPDKASFDASSDKESSYEQMKKYYTDVNKVYTKKEQTGAVDANGDPIAWPTFAELRRAYNQATSGDQWYDWNIKYDGQNSINGGNYIPVGTGEYTRVATGTGENTTERDYSFADYEGWHQFSLSMATYVAPDKTTTQNNYVPAGWYTLCIPFSLTEEQLIKILGVPRSTDSEKSYVGGVEQTGTDLLPDLRTLRSVTRKPGTTNKVTLMFTNDLTQTSSGNYQHWNINDANPGGSDYAGNGALKDGQKIAIRGGYPYLVKPYLPADVTVTNLGEYIMTRFSKMFTTEQSCLNIDGCYEDLVAYDGTNKTGRFAKPYENHKIQAYLDVQDIDKKGFTTHSNGKNYYYTFVGQFWEQKLPRYSFYMVENNTNTAGKWYWYHSGNKNYTWAPYKCVIMVTPEVEDNRNNSGDYRADGIDYPTSSGTDAQGGYIFNKVYKLAFRDGLDDMADFNSNARMHIFTLDNFEFEFEDDNTTSIEQLDGVDIIPANSKVYNMNGQLVGNSLEGLSKGMYIVNGKKYIVK